ncbi:hypothetical protein TGAM01_v205857 [Trichoderma gamsii]|uniref:GST N-terminal domain-containing protein n=1 Tax=Trichoderma gamsii TaxID=398673 RepID=A0A2P4ZLK3_9HYPO|nr:hypothetical protein TGAM01_v205857 [Trichoderma gamsii]PON25171.1 hypothetical protein TGAM01_v205857 [Trichoderma gamsii]
MLWESIRDRYKKATRIPQQLSPIIELVSSLSLLQNASSGSYTCILGCLIPEELLFTFEEKGIPSSNVTIVPVTDPQLGNHVDSKFPAKPPGSLPILAIPQYNHGANVIYIRQSLAIMSYLNELCDNGAEGFPDSRYSMRGADALEHAHINGVIALADECTTQWNAIRLFSTGAGPFPLPDASNEMLRWVRRSLMTIEAAYNDRDLAPLIQSETDESATNNSVNLPDVVLYQFLEFTVDCYGVDMTQRSGKVVKDVYGRDVLEKFPKLVEFYNAFKTRISVIRDAEQGEVPPSTVLEKMKNWHKESP